MAIVTGDQATAADVKAIVRHFTEMVSSVQTVPNNAWTDWDLVAIVPANTKSVIVDIHRKADYGDFDYTVGARKNGSSDTRTFEVNNLHRTRIIIETECDSSRIIELYGSTNADTRWQARILGYWAEAT